MQVKLDLSPDTDIKVVEDDDGNILSIIFTPNFTGSNAQTVLAYGASLSIGNKVLERFSLLVSGANGRVTKKSRSGTVTPAVDREDAETPGEEDEHE